MKTMTVTTSPSPEVQAEPKLPWQAPAVTEFTVGDVTLSGPGVAFDGLTYS